MLILIGDVTIALPKLTDINDMARAHLDSESAHSSQSHGFLATRDRDSMLDSIAHLQATAVHISNRTQLNDWVQGPLHALIPHQKAILGFGQVGYSTIRVDLAHTLGFAEDYFAATYANAQTPTCPVMSKWLQQRMPQSFRPDHFCRTTHSRWHNNVALHQIENGVFDGSVEYAAGRLSFIMLLNVERSLESAANLLSKCVTPLLADICKPIGEHAHKPGAASMTQVSSPLTPAEREVHRWLRQRKTNWEIGHILGKSESTVKTQVQKMLKKTGLESRHALAACEL